MFSKFQETTYFPHTDPKRAQIFLSSSKYEGLTLSNFQLTVIYTTWKSNPKSITDLLTTLNDKDIKQEIRKFKSDLLSKDYLIKEDSLLNFQNFYFAYKQDRVTVFGINDYYNRHPEEIKGRIMTRDLKRVRILLDFFK